MSTFSEQLEKHGIQQPVEFFEGENKVLFPEWINTGRHPNPHKPSLFKKLIPWLAAIAIPLALMLINWGIETICS